MTDLELRQHALQMALMTFDDKRPEFIHAFAEETYQWLKTGELSKKAKELYESRK